MAEQSGGPVPWRLFARALGYGAGCGAMLGVASVALLVRQLGDLVFVVVYTPYAVLVGGVVGSVVGLLAGAALVIAEADMPANEHRARPVSGAVAGVLILGFALWALALDPEAAPWEMGGWLWWFAVAVMSGVTGAAVGPRVARGRADGAPSGFDNRQVCAVLCRRPIR
jgi:cytochrome bd-type quinol oxidase subunit 2